MVYMNLSPLPISLLSSHLPRSPSHSGTANWVGLLTVTTKPQEKPGVSAETCGDAWLSSEQETALSQSQARSKRPSVLTEQASRTQPSSPAAGEGLLKKGPLFSDSASLWVHL